MASSTHPSTVRLLTWCRLWAWSMACGQIAQIFVPLTASPVSSADCIFQTLFAEGKVQCTTPGCWQCRLYHARGSDASSASTLPHYRPGSSAARFCSARQPNYQNPYSQQAEFGIEREIAKGWAVSLSGIYVHTIGLPVAIDHNADHACAIRQRPAGQWRYGDFQKLVADWHPAARALPLRCQSLLCQPAPAAEQLLFLHGLRSV